MTKEHVFVQPEQKGENTPLESSADKPPVHVRYNPDSIPTVTTEEIYRLNDDIYEAIQSGMSPEEAQERLNTWFVNDRDLDASNISEEGYFAANVVGDDGRKALRVINGNVDDFGTTVLNSEMSAVEVSEPKEVDNEPSEPIEHTPAADKEGYENELTPEAIEQDEVIEEQEVLRATIDELTGQIDMFTQHGVKNDELSVTDSRAVGDFLNEVKRLRDALGSGMPVEARVVRQMIDDDMPQIMRRTTQYQERAHAERLEAINLQDGVDEKRQQLVRKGKPSELALSALRLAEDETGGVVSSRINAEHSAESMQQGLRNLHGVLKDMQPDRPADGQEVRLLHRFINETEEDHQRIGMYSRDRTNRLEAFKKRLQDMLDKNTSKHP